MIYVLIGIFMALVFALCFLTDKLLQRLSKRADLGIGQSKVRLARANVIFGVILAVAGVALLLFFAARLGPAFYVMAAIIILLGLYLLLNYFMTGIDYSAEGFVYRRPGRKAQAVGSLPWARPAVPSVSARRKARCSSKSCWAATRSPAAMPCSIIFTWPKVPSASPTPTARRFAWENR